MINQPNIGLAGCRILVVEDEYLIADDLCQGLTDKGVTIVGPVGTLQDAQDMARAQEIQAAVVDINLRGEASYPLLDMLIERGIPVLLVTGYDVADVPADYRTLAMLQKPVGKASVAKACAALPMRAMH
jgi:DNA-binding response OmpR family regulator